MCACVHVCTVVWGSTSAMASKLGTAVLSRDVLSPESNYDWALLVRAADSCLSMDKVPPPTPEMSQRRGMGLQEAESSGLRHQVST